MNDANQIPDRDTDTPPADLIRLTEAALKKIRRENSCLIVAVTGSIACGKSTVSGMLQDLGSPLIDFDQIAREVVMPGTPGYNRIISDFGSIVVCPDGTLDRQALSNIVFADETKRRLLERITHPLIFDRFTEKLAELSAAGPDSVIQAGIPLLIEMNMQHLFDRVIVVYLPGEIQLRRLAARDNISLATAAAIIDSQLSSDEKKQVADYVIDNSRDMEETKKQVMQVWHQLQSVLRQRHQNEG